MAESLSTKPLHTSTVLTPAEREKIKEELKLIRKRPEVRRAYITNKNNVRIHVSPKFVAKLKGKGLCEVFTVKETVLEINLSDVPITSHDPVAITMTQVGVNPLGGRHTRWNYGTDNYFGCEVIFKFFSREELGIRDMLCFGYDLGQIDNMNKAKNARKIASLYDFLYSFFWGRVINSYKSSHGPELEFGHLKYVVTGAQAKSLEEKV